MYVLGFLDEVLSPCSISTLGDQGEAYTIPPLQKGGSGSCACMFRARQFFVMKTTSSKCFMVGKSLERNPRMIHVHVGVVGGAAEPVLTRPIFRADRV